MQAQATVRAARSRNNHSQVIPLKRIRFWLICLFFAVWVAAIAIRLFLLQVVQHRAYVERALRQQQRTFEVAPRRGVLYDRNLRELAMTVQVDSVYADPAQIADKKAAAHILAAIVHTDPADARSSESEIAARLASGHNFAWIARRVRPEIATRVRALNMKGIFFQKEFQRFYPDNNIAAQVLGYVGVDDNGLGGLEQKFDEQLHGTPGEMLTAMDARRQVLGSSEHEPEPGRNMVLTIDENIQYMAEKALDHAMERTRALNGTVVVQDSHTGQILALAIRPDFNPNDYRHTTPERLRNHAVSDVYEPGSTFKLVTYATALDQKVVTPDDMIDCQGGKITLAGRVIHDNQGEHFNVIPVHQALEVSSDVAAVKLALKVGPDKFYDSIRAFGFGSRSGVELPGETRGLLAPVKKWGASSIGSIAIGQEVAVTPVQLVTMVSTIANGGVYLPPHILFPGQVDLPTQQSLAAHPFKAGEDLPNPLPEGSHRAISTMAAAQMRKMMEGVVLFGTGKPAQLNGYSSGGKTGTAQKIDPNTHKYSKSMHIASFAGFAPVNNPVISVAVVIDTPQGDYYGTSVSAPVFAEVAQQVLEYLGVPHDIDLKPVANAKPVKPAPEDDSSVDERDIQALYQAANDLPSDDPLRGGPQPQPAATSTTTPSKTTSTSASQVTNDTAAPVATSAAQQPPQTVTLGDPNRVRVPSLTGIPIRKVIEQAAAAGLEVQIVGNGTCRQQAPAPGAMVAPNTKIVVRCGH
jgi:cell division protein FtsI (penicillin-binding protein 3)